MICISIFLNHQWEGCNTQLKISCLVNLPQIRRQFSILYINLRDMSPRLQVQRGLSLTWTGATCKVDETVQQMSKFSEFTTYSVTRITSVSLTWSGVTCKVEERMQQMSELSKMYNPYFNVNYKCSATCKVERRKHATHVKTIRIYDPYCNQDYNKINMEWCNLQGR